MAGRIAVVGAGANGAAIGADLTRAGLDVTLIEQWPDHVAAMRADGVRVMAADGRSTVTPVRVSHLCEVAEMRTPFDVILLAVKAYDTAWATELLKTVLTPTGIAVGLQNGITLDTMSRIIGPQRTMGSVIEVAANMFTPGVIEQQAPPWFAVGATDDVARSHEHEIVEILSHAGTAEISPDIVSSKWMKLVVNASELVPSAILGLALADAVAYPGMRDFMTQAGKEAVHTAVDLGNQLIPIFGLTNLDTTHPDRFAEGLLDHVLSDYTLPNTRTTVLQDWDKGRRAEVEDLNGTIVAAQRSLGRPVPANDVTVEIALRIQSGELQPGVHHANTLLAALHPAQ